VRIRREFGGTLPAMNDDANIRRYARSRLYDVNKGRYVSLEEPRQWQQEGVSFTVLDVETGEDVTRVLLA
jgi:polyhydroxyalkanoate synthesis regulator protein